MPQSRKGALSQKDQFDPPLAAEMDRPEAGLKSLETPGAGWSDIRLQCNNVNVVSRIEAAQEES